MPTYSIKMRASKGGMHVSGAERIIPQQDISPAISALAERALHHGLGRADFINIKMEEVLPSELEYLDALPVSTHPADTIEGNLAIMRQILGELGLADKADELIDLFRHVHHMRGALLYDIATGQRLEPDQERGIRVTYMDAEGASSNNSNKDHFREAIVLATKVVNAPSIISELCMSDDPDYVVGYISSKQHGYVRLTPLKTVGDPHGGRIFIFDSRLTKAKDAIHYLEKQKVLVRGLPPERPVNENPQQIFAEELARLKEKSLYRSMRTMESAQSKYVDIKGKRTLMLASNSYLDLANDARVKQAAADAALAWGAGSGGSRLTTGNTLLHEELEGELARFKGTEAALLFNTGYMANVGILSALCDSESVIFSDEYNHASIIDGARLSKARIFIFATSQAPSTLGAALAALRILESEPQHAQALQHNANFFLDCLHKEGVQAQSPTAIIPIIIGDESTALKVADELLSAGILVPAIRYPTVAKGTARLRVALMSSHTEEELARTAKLIAEAIKKYQAL